MRGRSAMTRLRPMHRVFGKEYGKLGKPRLFGCQVSNLSLIGDELHMHQSLPNVSQHITFEGYSKNHHGWT